MSIARQLAAIGASPEMIAGALCNGKPIGEARRKAEFTLPWPPTLNNCRAVVRGRLITTKRGREYHAAVEVAVLSQGCDGQIHGPVTLWIDAYYPDKRRRDLDNLGKLAIDGLVKAGVLGDDSQIVELRLRRAGYIKNSGQLHVRIFEEKEE